MNNTERTIRLNGGWVDFATDCWIDADGPMPEGTYRGHYWYGSLTPGQVRAFRDRAECELEDAAGGAFSEGDMRTIARRAASVLKVLNREFPKADLPKANGGQS